MPQVTRLVATIFHEQSNLEMAAAFYRFRKTLFVDERGWNLPVCSDTETDEFDTPSAVYCTLLAQDIVVGGFRAIRCDKPYLARGVFPHLATLRPYPRRPDYWEISRFGVRRHQRGYGVLLYSVMFQFALLRSAKALVAVADLGHERLLSKLGIRTRRYGPPFTLGDAHMREPIQIVAGEIPLAEQDRKRMQFLRTCTEAMEIHDDTLVWRPSRVSA